MLQVKFLLSINLLVAIHWLAGARLGLVLGHDNEDQMALAIDQLDPDLPNTAAFELLDEYLAKSVSESTVEANLGELKKLLGQLDERAADQMPRSLVSAIKSVLLLKPLADKKVCGHEVSGVLSIIMSGTVAGFEGSSMGPWIDQSELARGHALDRLPRLCELIGRPLKRILDQCKPKVEELLGAAIEQMSKTLAQRFHAFLSDSFIETWVAESRGQDGLDYRRIVWGQMNLLLDWSVWHQCLHRLILGQLFELTQKELADYSLGTSEHCQYSSVKWPQINRMQLNALVSRHIEKPCLNYLKKSTSSVFELHYFAARVVANYNQVFWRERSHQFKLDQFRYEFCRFFRGQGENIFNVLWVSYRVAVYKQMSFSNSDSPQPEELEAQRSRGGAS